LIPELVALTDTDHQDAIALDIKNVSPQNMLNAVYDVITRVSLNSHLHHE
jgi:hypothetical protein